MLGYCYPAEHLTIRGRFRNQEYTDFDVLGLTHYITLHETEARIVQLLSRLKSRT